MKLSAIAQHLECSFRGDGELELAGLASMDKAQSGELTFLANPKYRVLLETSSAGAVILNEEEADSPAAQKFAGLLVTSEPYVAFAKVQRLFHERLLPDTGVHPTAFVDPSAELGENVSIGPFCVVQKNARIGTGTILFASVTIYPEVSIGAECELHAGVVVREQCQLADRVIVGPCSVIGSDGFGFAQDSSKQRIKVPQTGIVILDDDVEIGANTCIDRAALGKTHIGKRVKIDNQVQIAHGVQIGEDSVFAAQVGISGSTQIGKRAVFAGKSGAAGHLEIGDDVTAVACAAVLQSVDSKKIVAGLPAYDHSIWRRVQTRMRKLPDLFKRVDRLEKLLRDK